MGLKLIKKQKFSKIIFFAVFLYHIEPTCQKLCFYKKNCEFWSLGPLLPFLKGPPNSSKNGNVQKLQFLLLYFVTLSLLTKNHVSITKTTAFSPLGPLRAPLKGPPNSSTTEIFKNYNFFCFTLSP